MVSAGILAGFGVTRSARQPVSEAPMSEPSDPGEEKLIEAERAQAAPKPGARGDARDVLVDEKFTRT